ncbi:hypothetical protein E2562_028536 [Oryza meyeriana var. granulata]|uniref:Uncharacterized protein n=1 Tax=Oryza meyeriana var. granulata TaxID=110450 RepID=A0A6G1EQN5_9ORYZ|nr:hypothetical protein E2562_028536 [Oryza meyeriana var. granulata]
MGDDPMGDRIVLSRATVRPLGQQQDDEQEQLSIIVVVLGPKRKHQLQECCPVVVKPRVLHRALGAWDIHKKTRLQPSALNGEKDSNAAMAMMNMTRRRQTRRSASHGSPYVA